MHRHGESERTPTHRCRHFEIFAPLIPSTTTGGLILGFRKNVGLDTLSTLDDGFEYLIEKDAFIKHGDPRIRFDRAKSAATGYRTITMCIVAAPSEAQNIEYHTGIDAAAGKTVLISTQ